MRVPAAFLAFDAHQEACPNCQRVDTRCSEGARLWKEWLGAEEVAVEDGWQKVARLFEVTAT